MRSGKYSVDVPCGEIHENFERVYEEHGTTEVSMAEGYLKDECLGFVTEYLQRFDVVHRRVWDAEKEYGDIAEVLEGAGKPYLMTAKLCYVAH
jgi:hypothetical protein